VDRVRVFDRSEWHTWLVSTLIEKRTQRGPVRCVRAVSVSPCV